MCGSHRAHAAGVRAAIPIENPLVIHRRGQHHCLFPVADCQQRELETVQLLLDNDCALLQLGPSVADRLVEVVGDQHPLAERQIVGLDHVAACERPEEPLGCCDVRNRCVASGRDSRGGEKLLHPLLGTLKPASVGVRAKHRAARCSKSVTLSRAHHAVAAKHVKVSVLWFLIRRPRDARVDRDNDDLVAELVSSPCQGVLAPSAPKDAHLHLNRMPA